MTKRTRRTSEDNSLQDVIQQMDNAYLLENDQCAVNHCENQFYILDTACSPFHLSLLEASYIKLRKPNLYKVFVVQIEFRSVRLVQSEARDFSAFNWTRYHRFVDVPMCY